MIDTIRIHSSHAAIPFRPGEKAEIVQVTIINQGNRIEDYTLEVDIPSLKLKSPEWIQLSTKEIIGLYPARQEGQVSQARVDLTIKPPLGLELPAGSHEIIFRVNIKGAESPEAFNSITLFLVVVPLHKMALGLDPAEQTGTIEETYWLTLQNQGNSGLQLRFNASDASKTLNFAFVPDEIHLPAHEERSVEVKVRAQNVLSGCDVHVHHFTITAYAKENIELTWQVSGTWIQQPVLLLLDVIPKRQSISAGEEAKYRVRLTNRSEIPIIAQVKAHDPTGACSFVFDHPNVSLLPGQEVEIKLDVGFSSGIGYEGKESINFIVAVKSPDIPDFSLETTGSVNLISKPLPAVRKPVRWPWLALGIAFTILFIWFVTHDWTKPTIQPIDIPASMTDQDQIRLNINANDNRQVSSILAAIDKDSMVPEKCDPGNKTMGCTFIVGPLAPGDHFLEVHAYDRSGNGAEVSVNFAVISQTQPTLTITYEPSDPDINTPITFTATADNAAGLKTIEIWINNSLVSSCNNSPCSFESQPYAVMEYWAVAIDSSGIRFETSRQTLKPSEVSAYQVIHVSQHLYSDQVKFDPAYAGEPYESQVISEIFPGLTRLNEKSLDVEPGVARSWDISSDGLTWIFYLHSGISWVSYNPNTETIEQVVDSNNQPRLLTANDFEYAIRRLADPNTKSEFASKFLNSIEGFEAYHGGTGSAEQVGVRALDNNTLEIQLIQGAGYFDVISSLWVMAAQPSWVIQAVGEDWVTLGYIQSYGPYLLKSYQPGEGWALIKNPYWSGTDEIPIPSVDEINWHIISDTTTLLALYQSGELDFIRDLPDDIVQKIKADNQLSGQLAKQVRMCTQYIGFNQDQPPFNDARVRRAFSLGLDRSALINRVLPDYALPADWFTPPALRGAPSLAGSSFTSITFDPQTARQLLVDAGYQGGSSLPPIRMPILQTWTDRSNIMVDSWRENLGAHVELQIIGSLGEYMDLLEAYPPQIWSSVWCADYPDTNGFLLEWDDNWTVTGAEGTCDEHTYIRKQLNRAASSLDQSERRQLYFQIEDCLVNQETVIIPLYWNMNNLLVQPEIHRTQSLIDGLEYFEKWSVETQK